MNPYYIVKRKLNPVKYILFLKLLSCLGVKAFSFGGGGGKNSKFIWGMRGIFITNRQGRPSF